MQDFLQGISRKDEKIESLVRMGFPKDEAEMAVVKCGMLSIEVVADVFLKMLLNKIPISFGVVIVLSLVYMSNSMIFCIITLFHPRPYSKVMF
jgi:hypothetical protein